MSPQERSNRIEERRQLLRLLDQNIALLRQMINETQQRMEHARRLSATHTQGQPYHSA